AAALRTHPAGLLRELGVAFDPPTPGRGPAGVATALALLAQPRADSQFAVAALGDALWAVADQRAQFPQRLGRQPDAGAIADAFAVGEDAGIGKVGLGGGLRQAADEAGVGEVPGPADAVREFLGAVGGAGAGFESGAPDRAEAAHGLIDEGGRVGARAVAEDGALGVEDTELDGVRGVVEADEQWYSGSQVGLRQMGRRCLVTPSYRRRVVGGSNPASSPSELRSFLRPVKPGKGGRDVTGTTRKPFDGTLWVTNPTW